MEDHALQLASSSSVPQQSARHVEGRIKAGGLGGLGSWSRVPCPAPHCWGGTRHPGFAVSSGHAPALCQNSCKIDWEWDDLTPLEYLPLEGTGFVAVNPVGRGEVGYGVSENKSCSAPASVEPDTF